MHVCSNPDFAQPCTSSIGRWLINASFVTSQREKCCWLKCVCLMLSAWDLRALFPTRTQQIACELIEMCLTFIVWDTNITSTTKGNDHCNNYPMNLWSPQPMVICLLDFPEQHFFILSIQSYFRPQSHTLGKRLYFVWNHRLPLVTESHYSV